MMALASTSACIPARSGWRGGHRRTCWSCRDGGWPRWCSRGRAVGPGRDRGSSGPVRDGRRTAGPVGGRRRRDPSALWQGRRGAAEAAVWVCRIHPGRWRRWSAWAYRVVGNFFVDGTAVVLTFTSEVEGFLNWFWWAWPRRGYWWCRCCDRSRSRCRDWWGGLHHWGWPVWGLCAHKAYHTSLQIGGEVNQAGLDVTWLEHDQWIPTLGVGFLAWAGELLGGGGLDGGAGLGGGGPPREIADGSSSSPGLHPPREPSRISTAVG